MDIQVHFQCVDTLFDILDMIGAVFYFATQVHIRYDTVSQKAVNTSFHEDRTFRQCLVAILKIRIGYEFQQISIRVRWSSGKWRIAPSAVKGRLLTINSASFKVIEL